MRFKFPMLLLTLLLLVALPVMAELDAEQAYSKAKENYQELLDSQKKQAHRDRWQKVIEDFLAVNQKYPKHRRAADALYQAGKATQGMFGVSRVNDDLRRAAELFDKLGRDYPNSTLADDALVISAGISENLGDFGGAYRRYAEAAARYPQGDMSVVARGKLRELASYAPSRGLSPPAPAAAAPSKSPPPVSPSPGECELTGIRFWSNPGYTRIVMDLSGSASYTSTLLPLEEKGNISPRLFVDIASTLASKVPETTEVGDGLLRRIRAGRPDPKTVRVVFDLHSFKDYKVFTLADPFRIIVDIAGDRQVGTVTVEPKAIEPKTAESKTIESKPAESNTAEPKAVEPKSVEPKASDSKKTEPNVANPKDGIARILEKNPEDAPPKVRIPPGAAQSGLRRIVVDAGHGGKDPGAIGPTGVQEKNVTLAVAKALAKRLEDDLGCEVILTRSDDTFLPLEERTAIANKVEADLFISIHANASTNRSAYGTETYYLNFSKNEKAAGVVARENGTSLKQVGDLELILFDLMANSKINESSHLATEIQKSLIGHLGDHYSDVRDLGVRQGPFYVLLGATMPSVLVETAFISHKREESRLTDRKYHERAAAAIAQGVRNYAVSLKMIAAK